MKSAKANITRGSESAVTWIFAFFGMHGNHLRAHGNHPWSLLSTNSTLFLFHSQDGARPSHGIGCATYRWNRSEEHTSELQSRLHLVCRLLLEKKKSST